jgi:hypothetical protein
MGRSYEETDVSMSGDISDKVIQTVIERVNESNSKFHLLKILQHRLDNLSAVML